jgi:hypothetical protein
LCNWMTSEQDVERVIGAVRRAIQVTGVNL